MLGDSADEENETFTVTLSGVTGASLGSPAVATVTITDDDAPTAIGISDESVTEGNAGTTTMTFDVSLSAPSGREVTVDYTTVDGTASAGSDFGARFGTLTFAPGEMWKTVAIIVNGDGTAEADESMQILLSGATGATIADATGAGVITNDDGDPAISIADATIIEGDSGSSNAVVTLVLSNPSSSIVSVDWTSSNGTAVTGGDYTAAAGTVTFAPGVLSQTLAVPVLADMTLEGNESFFVDLTNPSNASVLDAQSEVTIVDDDGAPALTISDLAVSEAAGTAVLTVLLVPASAQPVTANWSTVDLSASSGSDFTAVPGALAFAPGESSKTISISILDDNFAEGAQSFDVVLSSAVAIADGQATVTIIDDDATPNVTVTDGSVVEGSMANFAITLSNPSAVPVTVSYSTVDGSAGAGDYAPVSGTVQFDPGQTTKLIGVATVDETLQEPLETFHFDLASAANATIVRSRATASILDDDGTPALMVSDGTAAEGDAGARAVSFVVTLAGNTSQTVTVDYATADGTATAGSDYAATAGHLVFPPGTTTQTIDVPVIGDTNVETDETLFLNLSSSVSATIADAQAVGTITNDDVAPVVPSITISDASLLEGNAGTPALSFVVTLSQATTTTVTVDYATADGTATAGSDYAAASGTLVFAPGVTSRTISVGIAGDTFVEGDETLLVHLTNAANAALVDAEGAGTITNDDVPAVVPSISVGDAAAVEGNSGAGSLTFAVTLSAPTTNSVTVDFATADGSASAGTDYAAGGGTLVFAPGVTSQTITVVVAGDVAIETDETFVVGLANASNATIADAQAVGTILDDDVAPVIPSIAIGDVMVSEGNAGTTNATFTATLTAATTTSVTVDYATANGTATAGTDFASGSGTLVFAPGVTSQNVTIAVAGDTTVELNEVFVVNLSNATNATIADAQGTGTILNDDSAAVVPSIAIDGVRTSEGDGGARGVTVMVSLSLGTSETVTVAYATRNGTAMATTDYVAASGTLVFAPGTTSRSISITVLGDSVVEPDETFTVRLSNPAGATIGDGQAMVTILNDDEPAAMPVLSVADARVQEGNRGTSEVALTVTLSSPSTGTVMADYATSDGSATATVDYAETRGTVVFAPGQTSRSIVVPVVGDTHVEPDETFIVAVSNPIGATIGAASGTATIVDDDGQGEVAAVVVIAGAGPGSLGSFFRTALQLHNPYEQPVSGNLVIRPMGGGGSREVAYALQPRETHSVSSELALDGLVTIDVVALSGDVPAASVRVYDDAGAEGTKGFTMASVPVGDALGGGDRGVLLAPESASAMRYNVGVRALGEGARVEFTLRRADGAVAARVSRSFGANELLQIPATALFGVALQDNDAVDVAVTSGDAIVYGSAIDNASQDPSITFARALR